MVDIIRTHQVVSSVGIWSDFFDFCIVNCLSEANPPFPVGVAGGFDYTVLSKLGEGGFAKIYHITVDESTAQYAFNEGKVVKVSEYCISLS